MFPSVYLAFCFFFFVSHLAHGFLTGDLNLYDELGVTILFDMLLFKIILEGVVDFDSGEEKVFG